MAMRPRRAVDLDKENGSAFMIVLLSARARGPRAGLGRGTVLGAPGAWHAPEVGTLTRHAGLNKGQRPVRQSFRRAAARAVRARAVQGWGQETATASKRQDEGSDMMRRPIRSTQR